MCTYLTEHLTLAAQAKGPAGWFRVEQATAYFDHPAQLAAEHSLNLDFLAPGLGPGARVALELEPDSALELARGILSALASAPEGLVPDAVAASARQQLAARA